MNQWIALAIFAASLGLLIWRLFRNPPKAENHGEEENPYGQTFDQ